MSGGETPINVVTSCSAKGWQEYGRTFVETFLRYWPEDVGLYLISEDLDLSALAGVVAALPETKRAFGSSSLWDVFPAANAFHLRHHENPRIHGRLRLEKDAGWTPRKQDRGYNFRYDAYRFCKKVFSIAAVADRIADGRLFWIDADSVTFAPVPIELLQRLLPADKAVSCLDRGNYHSECGFVGYNLDHPLGRAFIRAFADLYASDRVLGLQEWHDSWVFDWLRREMKIPTHAIEHNDRHHPFVNSELGYFMDHLKGARKERGRTPIEQVKSSKKRSLPYWSGAAR